MANSSDNNPTPKSDERKLVAAAAASGADLDDQLAVIWEENKKFIIYSIVAVFAIFGVYHISLFLKAQAERGVQESYNAATDSAAKLAFAEDEAGSTLSGFAYKELGDGAYEAGEYSKAADYYGKAADAAESAIKDAALMGQAMAFLQNGQSSEAQAALKALIADENASNLAEARYRLASIAAAEKDYASARSLITELQGNLSQETFYWLQKALVLQSSFPEEAGIQ